VKDITRPTGYADFLDASAVLLQAAAGPEALRKSGLSELLRSPDDRALRTAGYAFLEMQGMAAATSPALSWLALADPVLLAGGAVQPEVSVVGFPLGADDAQTRFAVLGWQEPALLLIDLPGRGLVSVPEKSISSRVDGEQFGDPYVNVVAMAHGALTTVLVPERIMAQRSESMIARARLAAAAETLGACTRMFGDAVEYATRREQFGTPVVAFQAMRYQLAWAATDRHQLVSLIDRAVDHAGSQEPDSHLAEAVKALAGMVSRSIAQISLQVTGAIGFTWDYPHNQLHRRTMILDAVLGSAAELSATIGRRARLSGEVPDLFAV
jgi:hypothetical protein